jgi:hypothetical protein
LPGFTDPPYNTRVVAPASSLTVLLNQARMEAHAAWACSVDATTPVPIAQIGSYAMTRSAPPNWMPFGGQGGRGGEGARGRVLKGWGRDWRGIVVWCVVLWDVMGDKDRVW